MRTTDSHKQVAIQIVGATYLIAGTLYGSELMYNFHEVVLIDSASNFNNSDFGGEKGHVLAPLKCERMQDYVRLQTNS